MSKNPKTGSQKVCRPTFYMSEELLNRVAEQAKEEGITMSRFVVTILNFLLLSSVGQKLQENSRSNQRTLVQELKQNLILFNEKLPTDEIHQLAATSQRTSDQMAIYLVLLGLQVYKANPEIDQE
jgi:hypothetical protein